MAIKTLLVDDHRLILSGIRSMLKEFPDIEIIGQVETGEAAIRSVRELNPDVLVLDFKLPDISGLEVTQRLLEDESPFTYFNPQLCHERSRAFSATGSRSTRIFN